METQFRQLFAILVFLLCSVNGTVIPLVRRQHQTVQSIGKRDAIQLGGGIETKGEFCAAITLGTPPQTFLVQVDTGSSDLLVYGSDCSSCGSSSVNFYSSSASSTSTIVECNAAGYNCDAGCGTWDGVNACFFIDSYGDQSSSNGPVYLDNFGVGNISNVQVPFGYIAEATDGFEPAPADGIWGLSYKDLSWSTPAFDEVVSARGILDTFSMCLVEGSGVMDLGTDYSAEANFVWTPIVLKQYYNIEILGIAVGGSALTGVTYNSPFSIVDSGTTLMSVSTSIYNAIMAKFQSHCPGLAGFCGETTKNIFNSYCYQLTAAQISAYPDLEFSLQGISGALVIPSSQYLFQNTDNSGNVYYCGGLADGGSGTILGDTFMRGFHVVFDRIHDQIGFGPLSSCPVPQTFLTGTGQNDSPANQLIVSSSAVIVIAIALAFVTLLI